jgi:large subunit ribosomal protein L13
MKTYATKAKDIERKWHVIDASGKALGKLATEVAKLLMGKHKPSYAPYIDCGDYVIVLNASKIKITGNKANQKTYYRHSGYPGGIKSVNFTKLLQTHPTRVIEHAVKGMLPGSLLGDAMFKKLKVYEGGKHPHQAQVGGSEVTTGGAES